jgi:hypothetical protein
MQTRLVEEKHRVLMALVRLNQEYEVEREEPLETLAARLELDFDAGSSVV